jgi:pyridoxamine 5'-phosphate oxidase
MAAAPPRLQTLAEIEVAVWRALGRATVDKHHDWRTPVLATVDGRGHADARTVVLREVRADAHELVVFTDARAAKVAQLQGQSACTLVMWSPALGWQLRLRARVAVHTDGLAVTSRWAALRSTPAARDYLSPLAPGVPLKAAVPAAQTAAEREHFAVLVATIDETDWLELHRDGHRRARFDADGARWLTP